MGGVQSYLPVVEGLKEVLVWQVDVDIGQTQLNGHQGAVQGFLLEAGHLFPVSGHHKLTTCDRNTSEHWFRV